MKYNTINEYMGGGHMRPQMYQRGGLSRAARNILGRSFITRGVQGAERALREEGREARKEAQRRGLLGTVGGFLGNYVAPSLLAASGLGGVGLLGSAIAKGLGAGAGRYLGEALGGATVKDSDVKSPTGFLSSSFEDIKDYREELGEGAFGRALGSGASTALIDFISSGGFKALSDIKKTRQAVDPAIKQSFGFDIEKPELGLQRSLGEREFLTSGPLTGNKVSLSDAIPSELSTDSSKAIISKASSISSKAPEAQFPLRSGGLDFNPNISPVRYSRPMVGYDYYNRSGGLPSVSVGGLTVLGGSPRYGMNKSGLFNPMSNARRIL